MQSSPEYESSVLDHRFGRGDPYTMGVEEEYMLLDAETLDLVQHIDTVLAAVEGSQTWSTSCTRSSCSRCSRSRHRSAATSAR